MKKSIIILLASTLLFGCLKKEVNLDTIKTSALKPSFATPIGNAKLQVSKIKEKNDRYFQINPTTGILELVFHSPELSQNFTDLIDIPNQNYLFTSMMPAAVLTAFNSSSTGSMTTYRDSTKATFTVTNSEQIDSIVLDNGTLEIDVNSTYTQDIDVEISIPGLTKNGVAYSSTITLDYTTSVPVTSNISIPLDDYTIDLTDNGTTNNTLEIKYDFTITKGTTPATPGQLITFNQEISLDEVNRVFGFFGNRVFPSKDTVEVYLFSNAIQGDISFADPRAEFTFLNSTGIDFTFEFTSIEAPDNTTNKFIGGPGLTSFPTIAKAAVIYSSTSTFHQIDNSNTTPTLTTVMNERPSKFVYDSKFEMNPTGTPKNFIHKNSQLTINADLVLPLNGYGKGFSIKDTSDVEFKSLIGLSAEDADNINKITIRINTENAMPIEANLQVYFLDSSLNVIDSLLDGGSTALLNSSTVNFSVPTTDPNYGRVLAPALKTLDLIMTKDKYKKLVDMNQTKMIIQASSNTADASVLKNIKIFPEDYIDIKLSAKIDLNVVIK